MYDTTLSSILKDVIQSATSLIRSEINLAKAELKVSIQETKKRAVTLGICGVVAVMGLTALLAFVILGLGDLLGGRYWLSSLIVATAFLVPSAILALRAVQGFKEDVAFPEIPQSFAKDQQVLEQSVSRVRTDISAVPAATRPANYPHTGEARIITPPEFKSNQRAS